MASENPLGDGVDPHGAAARMLDQDEAADRLGIDVLAVGAGTATARLTVTNAMLNGHAIGHGGYVFLLADTAFAYACNSHGPTAVAASAQITYVAPAYEGNELYAYAIERGRFGRNGLYDVTVRRSAAADAPVVAEFRGTSHTVADRSPV